MKEKLKIHPRDNVAVCLKAQGEIPAGHKMALCDIPEGGEVIKYGCRIGLARCNIHKGEWVHTHNLRSALRVHEEYVYHPAECALPGRAPRTFRGFVRADGRVGIRNEIWILPTVGCVGKVAQSLTQQAREYLHGSVTDVLAFEHPYGCSQLGDDQENTRQALAALACHPNAGGVLVLGLGCENSGVEEIRKRMENCDPQRVKFLVCQDADDEMAEGLALLHELIDRAAKDVRQEVGEDKLVLGLKCGGSDGFSGLTANPVIGALSDRIVACGGASLLTEVPEMFGAEQQLMDRCENETVFDSILQRRLRRGGAAGLRKSITRQQSGRHHHAGGKIIGLHAEERLRTGARRAGLCAAAARAGTAPGGCAGERPGGLHCAGAGGRADRAVLDGARHAFCLPCAYDEAFLQQRPGGEKGQLDRL